MNTLPSAKVRNRAHDVRQLAQRFRHAAALVVNQDKVDFQRRIVRRQRQQISDDKFRFAGASRACNQAVRAMRLFVNIQQHQAAVFIHPNRRCKALDGVADCPAVAHLQLVNPTAAHHSIEREHRREHILLALAQVRPIQADCQLAHLLLVNCLVHLERHRLGVALGNVAVQKPLLLRNRHDGVALARQFARPARQCNHAQVRLRQLFQMVGNVAALLQQLLARRNQDAVRCRCILPPCHELFQIRSQRGNAVAAGRNGAEIALVIPPVGKPADKLPRVRLRRIVEERQLQVLIAVQGGQLHQHPLEVVHPLRIVPDDADNPHIQQRNRQRHSLNEPLLFRQRIQALLHPVFSHGEMRRREANLRVHRQRRQPQPQGEEIRMIRGALPQVRQHFHHARVAFLHIRRGFQLFFPLKDGCLVNFPLHVIQIRRILADSLFFVLLALMLGVFARRKRENHAAHQHSARHHQRRQRAHDAAAVRLHVLQRYERHHDGGHAHRQRRAHRQQQRLLVAHLLRRRCIHFHFQRLHLAVNARGTVKAPLEGFAALDSAVPCLGLRRFRQRP